jgi:transport family protein 27
MTIIITLSIAGVLVANKIDLDQRRVISPKAGKDFADANGLEYFECSAVSHQLFVLILQLM